MTLAADTRTGSFPHLVTEVVRTLRTRFRPSAPEQVSTGDALVRAMCHDMRSPLAALESALARLDDDTAGSELLELARAQTRHLASMLRTADATGGAPGRRGTRRLVDVVRASVDASGLPAHQLAVRLGEDAADVGVADARVQRVLTNLLENAHRHGEGRPVRLDADRRDGWVRLAVTQAGVPAEAVVSRLSQETPPVDLDGLGLWSVRRQTRELGGRLLWSQGADGAFTLVVALPDR
ncbi:sensor histidine kinase [Modestobacter versicolor]|uniref:histidine kinase n=1 Tax=Modestobacter versicolor TaxID=429133 RepID=A0A323VA38_9ACTN|nr:sensor histidine kinase [Modestobacter versicolor]